MHTIFLFTLKKSLDGYSDFFSSAYFVQQPTTKINFEGTGNLFMNQILSTVNVVVDKRINFAIIFFKELGCWNDLET
jgi:hypothetical protein